MKTPKQIPAAPFACSLSRTSFLWSVFVAILLAGCADDLRHKVYISAADQAMVVIRDGKPLAKYPVSTSKFGLSDKPGSYGTPLGKLRVKTKIGEGAPSGAVFKGRVPTGEILPPNAPGRDPIVTRIIWLEGLEGRNRNAYKRFIYIHGTPEECNIGTPASFGCIRMRSADVIALFDTIGTGARVVISQGALPPEIDPEPVVTQSAEPADPLAFAPVPEPR